MSSLPQKLSYAPLLKLHLATTSDLPSIVDAWYAIFTEPFVRAMFPDTPNVRKWWYDHELYDMENKKETKHLIVKDHSLEGKERVVGYAKWLVPIGNERLMPEERFPPWAEDCDKFLCDSLFGQGGKERKKMMGDKQYYCEHFLLAT
jgi:hypothetical protein